MEAGFENDENERRTVYEELTKVKEAIKSMKMGSTCTVGASTGFALDLHWAQGPLPDLLP